MRVVRLISLSLLAAGCMAHSDSGARKTSTPMRFVAEVPLTFAAGGRQLPVPLVEVEVNGTRTLFIVDSGASHNVITRDFALANHVETEGVEAGHDHVGGLIDTAMVKELRLGVGAITRRLTDAGMIVGAPQFAQLGIGGFLSPQNFIERGFVVMDFPARKLSIVDGTAEQVREWIERQHSGAKVATLTRLENNHRRIFIAAGLAGHSDVTVHLDTGGSDTEFDDGYLGTREKSALESSGFTVGGTTVVGHAATDQTVVLAGYSFTGMKIVGRDARTFEAGGEPFRGSLGMDVLKTLVVGVPASPRDPILFLKP
jgi:hypothetical protein